MERCPVIKLNEVFADTIWSSPRYHGRPYQCKKWPVVIIIAHRWFLGPLITATSLELSVFQIKKYEDDWVGKY